MCAQSNFAESAKLLIQHRADINQVTDESSTPLYVAAQEGKHKQLHFIRV